MRNILCTLLGLMCHSPEAIQTYSCINSSTQINAGLTICRNACAIIDANSGKILVSWPARDDGLCYSADMPK